MARQPAGRALRDSVIGDLVEERRRRAARSPVRAAIWFWTQAAAITLYVAFNRIGTAVRRGAVSLHLGLSAGGRELRYAFRVLGHARWYAMAVIGVTTLAVALSTTVFAVVDGVLFKPLPYPQARELVSIQAGFRAVKGPSALRPWLSAGDVAAWREAIPDAAFTIFRTSASARLEETNDSPLGVAEVDSQFFNVIGVRPLMGGFSADDFSETSTTRPTIISYQLWQTRFDSTPGIIGQRIVRGTASMEIVGVLPPGFVFPAGRNAQVLMPLRLSASERSDPRLRPFEGIARIPSIMTPETMRERIEAAMVAVARSFPPLPPLPPGRRYANPDVLGPFDRAEVVSLDEWLSSRPRTLFIAVFAAAATLVLLGCVNVSGLMAARSLDRQREVDLRRALGARAEHIAALVLAESGLLSAAGTALGVALSVPALRIVAGLLSEDLTLLKVPAIDWRVAAFAAIVLVFTVVGVSAWPIRRGLLAAGPTGLATSRTVPRVRSAGRVVVVSVQIAIGLTLTLGGALLVGSLVRLQQDDIGIDARDVFAVELRVPENAAGTQPGGTEGILTRILEGARSVPGVTIAGATDAPLLRRMTWGDLGWKLPPGARGIGYLNVHGITSGFFDVVHPRLLEGRLPSADELDTGQRVVVISQSIAKALWPTGTAVGKTLEYTLGGGGTFLVVGVVADARFAAWDEKRFCQIYAPLTALRRGSGAPSLLIRTTTPGSVLSGLQRFMRDEGADVRAIRAMPLTTMLGETVRSRRFQSWLFGSFAAAALSIVGIGVLGLMAMTAARRTREIGLRVALGATREGVVRLFIREQVGAVAAGLVAGSLVSAWAAGFLQAYLYGLTPYDVRVWLVAIGLVGATAMAGTLIPAVRACRVDPATALRVE